MQFYDEASREVSAIPGVRKIGWSTGLPYGTQRDRALALGDRRRSTGRSGRSSARRLSGGEPGYFDTLDLPIVAGPRLSPIAIRDDSPMVCIVNEAFVRRYLGGRDPIGVRVATAALDDGLVPARSARDRRRRAADEGPPDEPEPPAQMYVPLAQFPWTDTYLVVQASEGPVQALLTPIREAIARIDRNVPVRRDRTLTDLANLTTAPHRFRAVMVGTFAALALVLAMVGIFGVLAYRSSSARASSASASRSAQRRQA